MGALIRAKLGILKAGAAALTKGWDEDKHPRGKKGTHDGGKFVAKPGHDLFGDPHDLYPGEGAGTEHGKWWESFFGQKHADHEAEPKQKGPPPHSYPKPGSVQHPKNDDKGHPVFIRKPTPEGDPAAWHDPHAVATAIPGGHVPDQLHGVSTNKPWTPPTTDEGWRHVEGQNPKLDEHLPDLSTLDPHLRPGAGVIIEEPDGRVWITRPTNSFGGYHHTFPKGGTEPGHSLQATAIKEAYEETGMKVRITGVVGDFKRTTSVARYYTAQREGGSPADMGWESQAMRLVPKDRLPRMLNMPVDHDILATYLAEQEPHHDKVKKARPELPISASFATMMQLCADPEGEAQLDAVVKLLAIEARIAKFDESKHPRGSKGTHEGGKFVSSGTSVMFEVAPDPNDKALTDRWNALPEDAKLQISKEVAADVLPEAMKRLNAHGTLAEQIGGYMGQTNPSLALDIDPRNAVPAAKLLGHALSQDSMMVVSAKPATGLDPVGVVAVKLPAHERDIKSIAAIHEKLYALKGEDGSPLVGGFTASHGRLEILNFSGLPDERLASLVDEALGAKYQVHHTTAYAAFVEKKDYGYAGNAVAEGRAASVRGGSEGGIRAAATAALETRLKGWEAGHAHRVVKSSGWDESKHPRWPKGTPLAGQFMNVDEQGYTKPPVIGGGKSNPQYDKQAQAYYNLAKAGHWHQLQGALDKVKGQLAAKANKVAAGNGTVNNHDKWKAKLLQYGEQLQHDHAQLQSATAKLDHMAGPDVLSSYKKIGAKPGGSNPGALYTDTAGTKVLVKGNNAFIQGSYGADVNTMRAQNEVLASKLLQAAGAGVPDIKAVELGKEHGGGTGVAVTWMDGLKKIDPNNPAHLAAARADFAAHAWLANYDVIGMGKDNTAIAPNGKAVNVDPGGALLFRAQGQFKNELQGPNGILPHDPIEWDSLRHKTGGAPANPDAWHIYGGMTDSELKSSASKLSVMSDAKIKELVDTYGPGTASAKANLTESLIARRDAIMAKAGLKPAGNGVFTVSAGTSVNQAVGGSVKHDETPGNAAKQPETHGTGTKPTLKTPYSLSNPAKTIAADMEAAHAKGDIAALKALTNEAESHAAVSASGSTNKANWNAIVDHGKALQDHLSGSSAKKESAGQLTGLTGAASSLNGLTASDLKKKEAWGGVIAAVAPKEELGVSTWTSFLSAQAAQAGKPGTDQWEKQIASLKNNWLGEHESKSNPSYKAVSAAVGAMQQLHDQASGKKPGGQYGSDRDKDGKVHEGYVAHPAGLKPEKPSILSYYGDSPTVAAMDQFHANGDLAALKAKTAEAHDAISAYAPGSATAEKWQAIASYGDALSAHLEGQGVAHAAASIAKPSPPSSVDHPASGVLPKIYANNIEAKLNLIDKKGATPEALAELKDVGQSLDLKAGGYDAGTPVGKAWKDVYEYHKQAVAYAESKLAAAAPAASTATGGGRIKPPTFKAEGADKIKQLSFENQIGTVNSFVAAGDADGLAKIIHNTKNGQTYPTLTGTDKANEDAILAYGEAKWKEMTGGQYTPSMIVKPTFSGASAGYYDKHAQKMIDLHNAGDLEGLKAAINKPNGEPLWGKQVNATGGPKAANGIKIKSLHDDLVANLSTKQQEHVVAAVEAVQQPAAQLQPGEKKGKLPAAPNFEAAKLPPTNTNAGSHNAKVTAIMDAMTKGDPKAILAMKFGTNTYAKKQVQLANDTLAAMGVHDIMGVPAVVTVGQKANSHPALTGGVKPDVAMAAMQAAGKKIDAGAMLPAKPKVNPALSDKELTALLGSNASLNFHNWQGKGKGLSSSEHYNTANQTDYDNIIAYAKKGDLAGLKAMTYQPVNKETGAPLGPPQPMSSHPSQYIAPIYTSVLQQMDEKANPPSPLEIFQAQQAAATFQATAAKHPPKPFGTHAGDVPSSERIGHFIAIGQVSGFDQLVPKKLQSFTDAMKAQTKTDYNKMSAKAKAFISQIQSGVGGGLSKSYSAGGYPWHESNVKAMGSSDKETLRTLTAAAHEFSRAQPPGTVIYKWDSLTSDMRKKFELAKPGLIIQNPAPQCASFNPSSTSGFGSAHRFKIIYGPGARTMSSYGSGSYSTEGEMTLLPNARFMLLKHEKAGTNGHAYAETTLLLLPPDPSFPDTKLH